MAQPPIAMTKMIAESARMTLPRDLSRHTQQPPESSGCSRHQVTRTTLKDQRLLIQYKINRSEMSVSRDYHPTMDSYAYPVAKTPPGGYGREFPPLVLPGCTEPLVEGAPDLRGIWRIISATRGGTPVQPGDPLLSYRERIEQAGNRIVDCGGGTIADCRADGTEENGVHDVSAFDYTTPIHVIATYENETFVLRPVGLPGIEVTRRLDNDGHMVWTRPDMGGMVAILERVGPPE